MLAVKLFELNFTKIAVNFEQGQCFDFPWPLKGKLLKINQQNYSLKLSVAVAGKKSLLLITFWGSGLLWVMMLYLIH